MADLEYPDVHHEVKGAMAQGRLKLTDQNIIFKNTKTGKVDTLNASDIDLFNWQKLVNTCGLRIFLKNGTLHRYHGFKETEQEKISKFITNHYKKDLNEKEMSVKGWNWGTAKFSGSLMSFDVGRDTAFEIPLNYVSQCTTGKNEVTVEFHQNDDAAVSLMEMRFHIPSSELAGEDPVDAFHQNIMNKASVISVSGDALAIFREIHCLNPRGRYDIKMYSSFFQLHGKTFDYKIPAHTVLRLFLLPHADKRQIFFVVSLDPPIKQGQTRYHYLVFLFAQEDDEITVELPYTDEELKTKYEGKLEREMKGQTYEVIGKLMKAVVGRKLTMPSFVGKSDTPAIACSYKAAAGYIYPLERGFMYLRKPPFYIRFEEISSVNFARSGGSTRSFDFEVETKAGTVHTFSSIEKDEYGKLFDFITAKKLTVKNRGGKSDKPYTDDLVDSDQEEPDAYLARVKREAKEREDEDDGGSGEESTDEDFNPNQVESDVAEEYDSNAPDSTDSEDGSDGSEGKEKKKKQKKAVTVSEKPRAKRKEKKEKRAKDKNAPKRPQSAYFIWMNKNREKIKEKLPGGSVADIAKKAGEMWRELKDKTEWENKAKVAKSDYEDAMKEYKASGGGADAEASGKGSKTKKKSTSSPTKVMSGSAGFKSKEFLSDSDSSGSDDDKKKTKGKADKAPAKSKSSSDSESEGDKKPRGKPSKKSSGSDSEDNKKSKKPSKASKKTSDSESDHEDKRSKKRKKGDSDKDSGKKKQKAEIVAEEDDEFPEEPEESTPPTTSGEEASGSDSD